MYHLVRTCMCDSTALPSLEKKTEANKKMGKKENNRKCLAVEIM